VAESLPFNFRLGDARARRPAPARDEDFFLSPFSLTCPPARPPATQQLTGLLRAGLLTDLICAHDAATATFYTLTSLGADVCGHRGVAHGGLSAALLDETLGGAVYLFKAGVREGGGVTPSIPGATAQWAGVPAFTAALDVAYKAPVPAGATLAVAARVDRVEGRKAWVVGRISSHVENDEGDGGGGDDGAPVLYSEGRALFVVPRAAWEAAGEGIGGEVAAAPGDETEAGVERRVVHSSDGGGGV
jgi:acyl-coenzyme A thioesterase PaaI-like protein